MLTSFNKQPLPKKAPDRVSWGDMHGSSIALAIGKRLDADQPIIVICPDNLQRDRILREVAYFTDNEFPLLCFPDWETLPYDHFSPHQDIISERLATLSQLPHISKGLVIVSISTVMQRLPPLSYVQQQSLSIKEGMSIDISSFRRSLESKAYQCVSQVFEHGEFAVRGSIIDIYPMGCEYPLRIDLFDEEIETICRFDPETQRSIDRISEIELLPARECPLDEASITRFRQAWREQFHGNPQNCSVYQDVSEGLSPAGIEYYLPLFFEESASFLDYCPSNSLIIPVMDMNAALKQHLNEIEERYEQLAHDLSHPILQPIQIYLTEEAFFLELKKFPQLRLSNENFTETKGRRNLHIEALPQLSIESTTLADSINTLTRIHPMKVLFCAESLGRREILLELLSNANIKPQIVDHWQTFLESKNEFSLTVSEVEQGWSMPEDGIAVITEFDLFGHQTAFQRQRQTRQQDPDAIIRSLTELHIGSLVVHIDHGVGRYQGLCLLDINQIESEYLILEYAAGDRIYVPVSYLHLISRYSGVDPENAPLHKLGSEQWSKAKSKAIEKARDVAAELLDLHARRAANDGHACSVPEHDYLRFTASFPYVETDDQIQAINSVIEDMCSTKAMDRLICGDVGFGKTEVAMRAAFIAVQNNKQVAILVPTTLLAQQHYVNFQERFVDWPINVDLLSRFRNAKEQKVTLSLLADGKVDIIIGTHKLLQDTIKFKDLGLLIIDEEHRFGVRQKERIKALREEMDILTLTATPIPRTLNSGLSGLSDISIIATPPARRLSIKTFISEHKSYLVREAIMRELMRGGQTFFLHNDIQTINRKAEELEELIPEARIGIAHGQLHERELERIMNDFYHKRFHVLLCSTIIETGIDMPSVNTIIINRADRFGLAQLQQLRGRVGRSHHQAYAYLIVPPKEVLSKDAKKRLDAITSLEDLGAGFMLATHDMEIRGAGELLGEEQSGHMQSIGYILYLQLLERAVEALKSGKEPNMQLPLIHGAEVDLRIAAIIPDTYLPDVHQRLILYKRIANADSKTALKDIQVEMIDRFGLLPEPCKYLFRITQLKLLAQSMGIKKIEFSHHAGKIEFTAEPLIATDTLLQLIQKKPERYQLAGPHALRCRIHLEDIEQRFQFVEALLQELQK